MKEIPKYKVVRISKIAVGVGFIQNLPEGQYSEKICETLFDTGSDKRDADNSEKYAKLICDALNGYQLADCEYWKKRCEAAEAYAYTAFSKITGVMSGDEEKLFNEWQQLKSQEPR